MSSIKEKFAEYCRMTGDRETASRLVEAEVAYQLLQSQEEQKKNKKEKK